MQDFATIHSILRGCGGFDPYLSGFWSHSKLPGWFVVTSLCSFAKSNAKLSKAVALFESSRDYFLNEWIISKLAEILDCNQPEVGLSQTIFKKKWLPTVWSIRGTQHEEKHIDHGVDLKGGKQCRDENPMKIPRPGLATLDVAVSGVAVGLAGTAKLGLRIGLLRCFRNRGNRAIVSRRFLGRIWEWSSDMLFWFILVVRIWLS